MDIRDQYQMRSQYDEVSRQRTKLPPWYELAPTRSLGRCAVIPRCSHSVRLKAS